jgi:hypothetical protein
MTQVNFKSNGMEIYISFPSNEDNKEVQDKESINLGQAQIFMDISQKEKALRGIRILLPTPLSQEAMDTVKKLAKKLSEIKISSELDQTNTTSKLQQDEIIEELEDEGKLKKEEESQEGGKQYEDEIPRQGK